MAAYVAVLKGQGLRRALAEALADAPHLGGQERRFVAFATRDILRHQRLIDLAGRLLGRPAGDWALREDLALARYALWRRLLTGADADRVDVEVKLPGPLRPRAATDAQLHQLAAAPLPEDVPVEGAERAATLHSFPTWLAEDLSRSGEDVGPLLEALNREPQLILRARPPGSRARRIEELRAADLEAHALEGIADALMLVERGTRVFDSEPMKRGHLQVQDAGSQLIAELCCPDRGFEGARIADVCAGAGGKTLTLADRVGPMGRIEASDLAPDRLAEARRRARAWRLKNVHFPASAEPEKADVILIDAPCSGTGNLGKEPDQKWKLTRKEVARFAERQRALLGEMASRARPGAIVVYATCSLLKVENQDVVEAMVSGRSDLQLEELPDAVPAAARRGPFLETRPGAFPGGGFFGARLRKR